MINDHLKDLIKDLPQKPGVYKFLNRSNKIIYIGKANPLYNRLYEHCKEMMPEICSESKLSKDVRNFSSMHCQKVQSVKISSQCCKMRLFVVFKYLVRCVKTFIFVKIWC